MMDELRDYRFYGVDLLHPSSVAIDYIWERFKATFLSVTTYSTLEDIDSIQKGLLHKPFHPHSESHQKFVAKLEEKIVQVQAQFPFIEF
jgi:hypothetical protein